MRLAFIDFETNGIHDPMIVEAAIILYDSEEYIENEYESFVLHYEGNYESKADILHKANGLIEAARCSAFSINTVDELFYSILKSFGVDQIAGFSAHFDRRLIEKFMPLTHSQLNHRVTNISTLREVAFEADFDLSIEVSGHRALSDCRIALNFYKSFMKRVKNVG